jgi:hypothetical protein
MTLDTLLTPSSFGFFEILSQRLDALCSPRLESIETREASRTRHQFMLEMLASNSCSFGGDMDAQNMLEQFSGRH